MENKCKRFLSLLLAFVMVLGMFPAGHVHAEENGNTINLTVGGSHTITVNGNYEGLTDEADIVDIDADFVKQTVYKLGSSITNEALLEDGLLAEGKYIFSSNRERNYCLSNEARNDKDNNGRSMLVTVPNKTDDTTVWSVVYAKDENGAVVGYHVYTTEGTVNKYLKVSSSGVVTVTAEKPVLEINWNGRTNAWEIAEDGATVDSTTHFRVNHNNWGANNACATTWSGMDDGGSQWTTYQVLTEDAKTTSGNPVSWDTGLENGAEYLIIGANVMYRGNGNKKAVTNTLNPSSKLVTKVVDVQNFGNDIIWKLAVDSVAENGSVTGKLESINPSGDLKYLGIAGSVTLVNDGTVTIEHGNRNAYGDKLNLTWGIKIGNTYLNDQQPLGTYSFDEGSHWCFYKVIPVGSTTITFTAVAAGETDITIGGTTYHIVVTGATVDPDPSQPVDPDPSQPEEPEVPELPELEVIARYTSNRLSWEAVEGTTYTVEYSTDGNTWANLGTASGKFTHDTGAVGTQYFYRLAVDGNYSEPVQGAETGMEALLASATHYKVYENGIAITNGLNANGEKEIFAEGADVAKLNALESGTIIYKANNTVLSGTQAVLGTDTNCFVGTYGNKFRHDVGGDLKGNPDHNVNSAGIDYLAGVVYDRDASHWALASQGTRKAVPNTSGFKLLANTGATVYYVGCSTNNGNVSNAFTGTVYSVIVTGEVLTDEELSLVTTYNCGNHAYTNCEDTICNKCGFVRQAVAHTYDNNCDTTCNVCSATRVVGDHTYTNKYDSDCNECGAVREGVKQFTSELINHEKITGESSSNGDGKTAENAFNGTKNSNGDYWHSKLNENGIKDNEYLIAILDDTYLINQVVYYRRTQPSSGTTYTGRLLDCTIFVSTDKVNWTPVITVDTLENQASNTISFHAIEAKYVKLTATKSDHWQSGNLNKVMTCAEVEIFRAVCKDGEHVPNNDDGNCTTAITCSICGTVTTDAKQHSYDEGKVTTDPTLDDEGEMTYTCTVPGCEGTKTETIAKLVMVAQPLMDGWNHGTVALADCEYTITGSKYAASVCHGGNYYVKPGYNGDAKPQKNASFGGVMLGFDEDGKIKFTNNGSLFMYNNEGNPSWGKVQSLTGNETDGTGYFYLLKANPDSTFNGIRGYEQATSVDFGTSYLIAANFGADWFVMYPSTEAVSIAKVEAGTVAHEHKYTTVIEGQTCGYQGEKTKTCACGHVHFETIAPDDHYDLIHVEAKAPTCTEMGNIEFWYCNECGGAWLDEARTLNTNMMAVRLPASHTFTNYVYNNDATFDANGSETATCDNCTATDTREAQGTKLVAVATANGTKYQTLAEAVAAGGEVKLLADANGNGIIIDKNVVIDLGGFTYTIDGVLVGSEGTKSCGFQILSGNTVTIKNGSIVMDEKAVRGHDNKVGNNFVIQNYANLTLENVAVTGNTNTSYVVSINSGNVAFTGNTSITAKKPGAVAFDVCKYASYAEPVVTVANTVTINGKIEAAAQVGGSYYATFEKAQTATGNEITLLAPVTVTKDTTYNLSGKTIISDGDVFIVTSGTLTLNGDGIIMAGTDNEDTANAVWADGGHVVINGGTYSVGGDSNTSNVNHQNDLIYTKNGGTVIINGGTFKYTENVWTLNENDANRGTITVKGGTFENFNPANNVSEGVGTNFVAKGYCSRGEDGIWTVYDEHAYDAGVYTEPTFDADGYTTYTCACGHSYTVTNEGTKKVAVAYIGGNRFESLAAAVAAAKSGDIIGLSVDTTEDIVMDQAGVTLILNGHTLYGQIKVNAANVTVNFGKIYAANKDAIVIGVKDNVNSDVSLTAGGLTVTSETDCAVLIYDGSATFGSCDLISNSTSYAAIQGSGTQFGNIKLGGGSVTSANEVAIYWPHVGTLTTSGGTITGTTGLYIKQGTAKLNGTKIIATGAQVAHTTNGNGGDSTGDAITVDTGATAPEVTMEGVNLNSANSNLVGIYGGTVTLTGANLNATRDAFRIDAGKLNIKNGSITAGECVVYIRGGDVVIENGGLTSTSTKYAAIQGNGNCGGNLTINNGSIRNDKNVGIYWPGSGSLTVNGGSINGTTGIYAKQGNVTITGGTIRGTGEKADYNYNGNGGNSTGDALVLESCNYGTLTANITGGTFESRKAEAVAAYAQNGHTELTGFVSGGTFSTKVEESYCAEGYIPTEKDQEGKYSVKLGTYVAEANGTKYETLAEAIAVGGEVKLLADVTLNAYLNVTNNVTLNLNDHNITRDGGTAIYVNGGMLTIDGEGKISGLQAVWADSGSRVVIKNGTFHGNDVTVYTSGTGYVEIYGGKFSADKDNGDTKNEYTVLNKMDSARDTSAIVVYGGTFVGFNPANNASEGANTNFVAEGYCSRETEGVWTVVKGHVYEDVYTAPTFEADGYTTYTCSKCGDTYTETDEGSMKVAVAEIGETKYETLQAAFDAAKSDDRIELVANVELDAYLNVTTAGNIILDLNTYAITREGTGIYVNNAETILYIVGAGSVSATQAVWANAGTVAIFGGNFHGIADTIYTTGNGHIKIYDGNFSSEETDHTADQYAVLNQKDDARKTSSIVVYGGTFVGFNPANNASEGANTNFVAEGYCAAENNGVYTVQAHTAGTSVKENEKAATCTTDGSYDEVVYCSNCDKELSRVTSTVKSQGHTAGTPVKENETAAGYDLVTRCTVCNAVMSTQHVDTLADKVIMKSINIHLEAEIQFAYSVIIPDELVNAGATVVLTKPGVKTVVKEFTGSTLLKCQSKDDEGNIFYVVKMGIPSGEMTVPVTLEVRDAEGNALTICTSGGEELGTSQAFAVVDYAKLVLNGNYDAKTKELVKAMIVYGGYAQTEFKTFTDKLAYNEVGIDADLSSVTVDTLNQDQYKSSQSNNNMGVKANGLKVFLDSDIYLRVFMTVEDDISNYTFKLTSEHGVVNKIVEPVRGSDGRYYIDITGIASAYLDEVYMITVTNTVTGATNEITASAMSYARTVLMGNYPESLKNVVKAMYLYNQAANAKWPGR